MTFSLQFTEAASNQSSNQMTRDWRLCQSLREILESRSRCAGEQESAVLALMVVCQVSIAVHTIRAVHAFLPGQHCNTYYTSCACIPARSALLYILYQLCMHSCQVSAVLQAAHANPGRLPCAAMLTMQFKLAELKYHHNDNNTAQNSPLHPCVALNQTSSGYIDY